MTDETFQWHSLPFAQLSALQVYDILSLRSRVFVVEQEILCLDSDELDKCALHLWASQEQTPVSYCRILPPGTRFDEPSIGRVCTSQQSRGKGLARILMNKAISVCSELFPSQPIALSSQVYLQQFYESLGFQCVSAPYIEEGIAHVRMRKD